MMLKNNRFSNSGQTIGGVNKEPRTRGGGDDIYASRANDMENLQDTTFLNAVVKVYCMHTALDYSLPWQKQRQYTSTGRNNEGGLLTSRYFGLRMLNGLQGSKMEMLL